MDEREAAPHRALKTHAALFDDMGQAVGLDLQEEAIAGRLNFDEIAEAVLRCTRCAHPETCQDWLRSAQPGVVAGDTPDYCRNRDLLGFLREPSQ
ncbi:DUF6455 family protein [Phaeobacter sp. QD34_3]|uniref:DUF6455 family protein n=1 Tax=unclassified Phaeobacter TaxID=2621772 RepID=UPI00237FD662|nr:MULTISPECIES: DUF6455 family protein [unclassified Phaeobacter]MDE4133938.1 DUF6455 family protein [Phaeobacter sp. QD34_3]MDE4137605.1 DUF6455 family protein [Phaeobacter sp. QD34_24]MDE4175617.1 DUF6455 family protein [Phaeobacter sp. PT47_59]